MRVALISTHRADRAHYAPLRRVLEADARFTLVDGSVVVPEADAAVVLGDRIEMLQAAIWMVERHIPLLHIHGGEHTLGSLDERYRWAMTMLADIHCVATEQAQWEVEKHILYDGYGTLSDAKPGFSDAYRRLSLRTYWTGAPGLDRIERRQKIGGQGPPDIVVLYNPAIDETTTVAEWAALVAGLRPWGHLLIMWIGPNGDRYSWEINASGEVDSEFFRDILAGARVIVGNSSAGIIEAPSLGTWAVNVGDRQKRRERAGNVIDVPADPEQIRAAVEDALSRPRYSGPNPYYIDGHASERIRDVLLEM